MIPNQNDNVNLASVQDKELMYDFAKELNFDTKARGRKTTRDRTLKKLLKSSAIMASGTSAIFLSFYPDELCHTFKLILQENFAGINSEIINEEIVAIVDKLLEYKKNLSKKQLKQVLIKCNLLHK